MTDRTAPLPIIARFGRAGLLVGLLAVALLGVLVMALGWGVTQIPAANLPDILFSDEGGTRVHRIVIWDIRLPRFLIGAVSGLCLGLSGVLLQDALRNDLADPGLLGVASGASLVVAVVVVLNVPVPAGSLPFLALIGGVGVGVLILLATRITHDPVRIILIGAALAALFSALITIVVVMGNPDEVRTLYTWLVGSLIGRGWDDLRAILPWALLAVPLTLLLVRPLNLLRLGDDVAEGLGLPVFRIRTGIFLVAIALNAPVIAQCGPIGFVALIAPHLARAALGTAHALVVLPVAGLIGAVLLTLSDFAAREVLQPAELPVGLLVTVLGAPVALWLLRRKMGRRG